MNFYFDSRLLLMVMLCAIAGCSCTPEMQSETPPSQQKQQTKPPVPTGTPLPKPAVAETAKSSGTKDAPVGAQASNRPTPAASAPAKPIDGTAEEASFGGVLSTLFGASPKNDPSSRPRRTNAKSLTPTEAAAKARKLISEAGEYSNAGNAGAAFKAGVSAFELLAPYSGDDECRGLLATLEPQLRRYADAANADLTAPSKPSSIR